MRYVGSCHCGDNRFEVDGEFGAAIERTPVDGRSL
jgi:hypothetical protein